ncbi:hypothetical protein FM107_19400 [Sphingobacterium sp. JB170]|nr:hypothetical protein FM107_19400 [Sphingobacterium sp. JB170]
MGNNLSLVKDDVIGATSKALLLLKLDHRLIKSLLTLLIKWRKKEG